MAQLQPPQDNLQVKKGKKLVVFIKSRPEVRDQLRAVSSTTHISTGTS